VNQNSPYTVMHDISSLLAAAVHRQERSKRGTGLAICLLEEAALHLTTRFIHVWEKDGAARPRLLWNLGQLPVDSDTPEQAVAGIVKQYPVTSATIGSDPGSRYLTSCNIGESVDLVLEFAVQDKVFDHSQILELAEILADLHRRESIVLLRKNAKRVHQLDQIVALLHLDLDPIRVASCLASDASEFLGCGRISVARRNSSTSWEIVAATAVTFPDPRADATRRLCGLIKEACKSQNVDGSEPAIIAPSTMTGHTERASGASEVPVTSSPYRVRPLSVSGHWNDAEWCAVFEWPQGHADVIEDDSYNTICSHAALAFRNCGEHSNAGLLSTIKRFPRLIRSRRLLIAAASISAVAASLFFLQIDLQIEVAGKLVPTERVFVFSPEDGIITDIFVEDGSTVAEGDVLCQLRNEDLQIQLESVEGELASTHARLAALDALRGDRSLPQSAMLSVEQAELKERVTSLETQARILDERLARLTLKATMAGQIYGDRLHEILNGRPVQRGQYLFEHANPESGWQLDMRIPEVDVRHVINGQDKAKTPLVISFAVETAPDKKLSTSLAKLAASTEIDEYGRLSVLATAIPEQAEILNPRPGAGIVAQIHCGPRSVGFVLFRRIIESIQRRWWK